MVLNEPENSLHSELLPTLARLIVEAGRRSQIWVISHSDILIGELVAEGSCNWLRLEKDEGETKVPELSLLEQPPWRWPDR